MKYKNIKIDSNAYNILKEISNKEGLSLSDTIRYLSQGRIKVERKHELSTNTSKNSMNEGMNNTQLSMNGSTNKQEQYYTKEELDNILIKVETRINTNFKLLIESKTEELINIIKQLQQRNNLK